MFSDGNLEKLAKGRTVKIKPKHGDYYDLIRVPHGHVPAPLANFWSLLPLPVKEFRDWNFYECPECGRPSFYKINYFCQECQEWDVDCEPRAWARYKQRQRRKYFKEIMKKIEYRLLPVFVLLRKAWYVKAKPGERFAPW